MMQWSFRMIAFEIGIERKLGERVIKNPINVFCHLPKAFFPPNIVRFLLVFHSSTDTAWTAWRTTVQATWHSNGWLISLSDPTQIAQSVFVESFCFWPQMPSIRISWDWKYFIAVRPLTSSNCALMMSILFLSCLASAIPLHLHDEFFTFICSMKFPSRYFHFLESQIFLNSLKMVNSAYILRNCRTSNIWNNI